MLLALWCQRVRQQAHTRTCCRGAPADAVAAMLLLLRLRNLLGRGTTARVLEDSTIAPLQRTFCM